MDGNMLRNTFVKGLITAILFLAIFTLLMVDYYVTNDDAAAANIEQVSIACFPTSSPTQMFW
jgi:hypothetical protein